MCEWYNIFSLPSIPNHCQKKYKREKRAQGLDGEGRNVLNTVMKIFNILCTCVYKLCVYLNTSMTYAPIIK